MERNTHSSFRPGYLINRTSRFMARWGDARLRPLGLGLAQLPVLGALRLGPSTQKELARLVQIEQPTMAELLLRMEKGGLITRSPDPKDKRSSQIALTERASEVWPQAEAILLEGSAMALKGLSEEEITTLAALLLRVMQNIEAALAGDSVDDV